MRLYLEELLNAYRDQQNLFAALPRGYDIVNPHGDHVQWAAAAYKHRYGVPAVWMCNDFWPAARSSEADISGGFTGKLKSWVKKPLIYPFERYDRRAVHRMDSIVVLSERVQAQMRDYYGVASTIIRTGIAAPQVVRNGAVQRRGDGFQLLTVCMLMPRRRIEDVLQALHYLVQEGVDIHYTIVGRTNHTPSYTEFVYSEIARLQLEDRVTFAGEVSEEVLGTYYRSCDSFVWPADEGQSWGMACMESMAYGKPVLVSKANGLAEVLEDGENALLFAPGDPQAIAAAVKRLISDSLMREKIAAQGQHLVQSQYSWRRNAEAMLKLFTEAQKMVHSEEARLEAAY